MASGAQCPFRKLELPVGIDRFAREVVSKLTHGSWAVARLGGEFDV
jgi:hypothetical protein